MQNIQITARLIIEMIGKPKEHIEKTLKEYIETLKNESKFEILKTHFEPAEQKGSLFSSFVELEAKFKDISQLIEFCFDAMPSSVDIIEPTEMLFETKILTDALNDLQARLHNTDLELKAVKAKDTILDKNIVMVFNNFIRYALKDGSKSIEELSALTGVKKEQLRPFLDELILDKKVDEKEKIFSLIK